MKAFFAKDSSIMNLKVMIVADARQQRLALTDTVRDLGFCLVESVDSRQLMASATPPKADLWMVDVDDFNDRLESVIATSHPKCVLMGFKSAPYLNSEQAYKKWQRSIIRKLIETLSIRPKTANKTKSNRGGNKPWQYVLFLGASMGGPDAVKMFLDHLPSDLPLAVIIAHHFDEKMVETLPRILTRHNGWRCQVITTTQSLQSGLCLIAPIDKQVVCDSTGRIFLTKEAWVGEYRPNIGMMLKNASEVYGSELIGIIFSGMGDDGSQYASSLRANRSIFWAQDPVSCACPSQPQAFIDTGLCQFVGTPKVMAERLVRMVKPLG